LKDDIKYLKSVVHDLTMELETYKKGGILPGHFGPETATSSGTFSVTKSQEFKMTIPPEWTTSDSSMAEFIASGEQVLQRLNTAQHLIHELKDFDKSLQKHLDMYPAFQRSLQNISSGTHSFAARSSGEANHK
jgi:hypothetical protein